MSEYIYIFTLVLIAATCVVIFGVRSFAAVHAARTREAREDAYRSLAAKATEVQAEAVARLARLEVELAGVSTRLGAIEKTLRSVE